MLTVFVAIIIVAFCLSFVVGMLMGDEVSDKFLIWVFLGLNLAFWGSAVYVAIHFITKFW